MKDRVYQLVTGIKGTTVSGTADNTICFRVKISYVFLTKSEKNFGVQALCESRHGKDSVYRSLGE